MKRDNMYTDYTDFLKDNQFIQWQLMQDETLDTYWAEFLRQYPELEKELQQAITYLKKEGLNKSDLDENERTELLERIQKTIQQKKRMKNGRFLWYISSSAVAVILLIVGIALFSPTPRPATTPDKELIVGELLNNEDIQLITSGEAIQFQNDVKVTLNQEGTAEIVQGNHETRRIRIAPDKLNSLVVPYGKRSMLTLADGSRVWLNSGSILEFPVQFSGESREIHLASGEMYIEVASDTNKPFYVQTANFNVKVYGTKFNISTYSRSPHSIVLVEGSVSLQSNRQKEFFITPNERAIYSDGGSFDKQQVDVSQFISWKDGYLSFDKTPMTDVLQQIGRYYNLSFDYDKEARLLDRTCSGKIYLSDNLDNVMTTVALLSSTKYEKRDNKIYITNKDDLINTPMNR